MDLGITGRHALVCGSSAGLGRACAKALALAGANVTLNGRTEPALKACAQELSALVGRPVHHVAADCTTAEGRAALRAQVPAPDILVNNAAGPPTGDFMDWDESVWQQAVSRTMVAPILLIREVLPGMVERRFGRIINITSSAVKAPLPLLGLSNGARSGLTGFVAGLAREVAVHGVTINNLLPGRFETARLAAYVDKMAASRGVTPEEAAKQLAAANPMKRFGHPDELGAFCAFLASAQAAYMTGQNLLLDGGEYPGL